MKGPWRRYARPRDAQTIRYAAWRGEEERQGPYLTSRLTWNPHFDDLAERVARLLQAD